MFGYPRVVAGDRVVAQSLCGGTDLAALTSRAEGAGHRRIGASLGVPAATVRGWLRRAADRLEVIWNWFLRVAVAAGVDVQIPDGSGCPWRDVLAAVQAATAAIRFRFGAVGWRRGDAGRVVVAGSGGRLLAPGWSPPRS
ncbi:hypothetical protein I553_9245 [Mycobacterium xenopi 4042]|uniref:Uncharacterized protein n=1 Tax=Mycobacterium xenopi 4042 TaxID=1299334 RepID=X8AAK3_MYCXE|nr:hypothetical protein I553_9245 [Mycobacterium xenopi 4042]